MYFVYRFIDKSKSVIYVGTSKQALQQRFKDIFLCRMSVIKG